MQILWSAELRRPTKPGKYMVKGLGEVLVDQEHIDQAEAMLKGDPGSGGPSVEVHEVTAFGDTVRQYMLGLFVP